jgi:hypothetical protein
MIAFGPKQEVAVPQVRDDILDPLQKFWPPKFTEC